MMNWQKEYIKKLVGMKPGEIKIMMASRQTGKSQLSAYALKRLMDDLYKEQPVEELILSEGTVLGARYYCVEPVGGSWPQMEAWAKTTYGEPAEVWDIGQNSEFIWPDCGRWYMNSRRFWFRDERDRLMFVMKWR